MSLRERLAPQLARFDDDALAAWGSRGLLRRAGKELESRQPVVERDDDEALVLAFAGHTQRFDARGPAQGECSCPAAGVCQHLLAAVLWLRGGIGADAEPDAGLHAALMAFTPVQLAAHAGKAGYRWAWQHLQDRGPDEMPRIGGGRNVVIDLLRPAIAFRYLGGGIEQLVADGTPAGIAKYRVAAVLAYQLAHGAEPEAPAAAPVAQRLDLGRDHALGESRGEARLESRERLREATSRLLQECVGLGLSHLSRQVHERFATLAVWAQGADYPRLARLLRRNADHVELLLERAGGADEQRLLEELALAHALVAALERAASEGREPKHLVGRARGTFDASGTLALWGLGALPWRSPSGYVGLSMLFWSPQSQGFASCTDARPESQRFDPRARYLTPGPWTGLGAPASATGRSVVLLDARGSSAGQLSASEKTRATVLPLSAVDLREGLPAVGSWAELRASRRSAPSGLLSEPQPLRDWVVLRPARYGAARFDGARQALVWPLSDAEGEVLEARVDYSALSAHAIERIEALAPEGLEGRWLVARLRDTDAGLVAEPLSLVSAQGDEVVVDALHFDAASGSAAEGQAAATAQGGAQEAEREATGRRGGAAAERAAIAAPRLPQALEDYRHWLQRCAERGLGEALLPRLEAERAGHLERLRVAGLTAFPAPTAMPMSAHALLVHHYVGMHYLRLADGGAEAPMDTSS